MDVRSCRPTEGALRRSNSRCPTKRGRRNGAREESAGCRGAASAYAEYKVVAIDLDRRIDLRSGSVAIAAITSCTNTSDPTVMVGGRSPRAQRRGARDARPATVKTSLAPGSRAVTTYLASAGLGTARAPRVALAGYGCGVHRQQRSAGPADRGCNLEERSRGGGRPVGQPPQFRKPNPSARAPRISPAAARRGVCARRPRRYRSHPV